MKFIFFMTFFIALSNSSYAQDTTENDFELELQKLEKGEWIKEQKQVEAIEAINQNEDQLSDQISVNQAAIEKNNPSNQNTRSAPEDKKDTNLLRPRRIRSR